MHSKYQVFGASYDFGIENLISCMFNPVCHNCKWSTLGWKLCCVHQRIWCPILAITKENNSLFLETMASGAKFLGCIRATFIVPSYYQLILVQCALQCTYRSNRSIVSFSVKSDLVSIFSSVAETRNATWILVLKNSDVQTPYFSAL